MPLTFGMHSDATSLVNTVGFDLIGARLGKAVDAALKTALAEGAIFSGAHDSLSIFRDALAASIRDIESHPRGELFQRFLSKGPYESETEIPLEMIDKRLSDEDTAAAIKFIYSYMVNNFKGAITELLAAAACACLLKRLKHDGDIPENANIYVGDAVGMHRSKGKGLLKGADLHILIKERSGEAQPSIVIAGVAEVKSYFQPERLLREQLGHHLERAKKGLSVAGEDYSGEYVRVGSGPDRRVILISVLPDRWTLPREFRFEASEHGRALQVEPGIPPREEDEIERMGDDKWRITLRWSKEALTEAAYEMTFWYMEKVGEIVYSRGVPKGWEEMSPAEGGRNAAKMMLYYAILRCRTDRENQRAIALYNSYGFGYALGMNFRNAEGKREMLWPQDLDEILSAGETRHGCKIY